MTAENFRTIWLKPDDPSVVQIIDQRVLPHEYRVHDLHTWQDDPLPVAELSIIDNGDGTETVTLRALVSLQSARQQYLRVVAELR